MEANYIITAGNWAGHLATNVRPIEDGAYCSWSRCTITLPNGLPFVVEVRTEWLNPSNDAAKERRDFTKREGK